MVLEIFIESEDAEGEKRRVLVERWVFRHDPDPEGLGSGGGSDVKSPEKALSVSAAYKQLVVFFRTLHAELRALPALGRLRETDRDLFATHAAALEKLLWASSFWVLCAAGRARRDDVVNDFEVTIPLTVGEIVDGSCVATKARAERLLGELFDVAATRASHTE